MNRLLSLEAKKVVDFYRGFADKCFVDRRVAVFIMISLLWILSCLCRWFSFSHFHFPSTSALYFWLYFFGFPLNFPSKNLPLDFPYYALSLLHFSIYDIIIFAFFATACVARICPTLRVLVFGIHSFSKFVACFCEYFYLFIDLLFCGVFIF